MLIEEAYIQGLPAFTSKAELGIALPARRSARAGVFTHAEHYFYPIL